MDATSASVRNIRNACDGRIVGDIQVCTTEDDDIKYPFNVNVKQEPIEEESYDVGHAVPYGRSDNVELRSIKTECKRVTSECSMAGIVKQEPAEEGTEGDVRYAVRCEEIDIVYEPDEPIKEKLERDQVKNECSTDPVAASSSNCYEQVLLPECSYQSTKDHSDTQSECHSGTKVLKSSISTTALSDGIISEQKDHTTFECNNCMKTFRYKWNLTAHKRIHTGAKPFSCDICEKKFTHRSSLIKHKRTHTGDKPFGCNVCKKKFTDESSLVQHKLIHSGEKPYECNVCMKKFAETSHLKSHERVHTGEKPFQCNICMKKFTEGSSLSRHKRIHSRNKPFECNVCMKKFSDGSNLIKHRLIHSGEKPYECNVCMKKFNHRSSFNRHKRIHSGD